MRVCVKQEVWLEDLGGRLIQNPCPVVSERGPFLAVVHAVRAADKCTDVGCVSEE